MKVLGLSEVHVGRQLVIVPFCLVYQRLDIPFGHVPADLVDLRRGKVAAFRASQSDHGCARQIVQRSSAGDGFTGGHALGPAGVVVPLVVELLVHLNGVGYAAFLDLGQVTVQLCGGEGLGLGHVAFLQKSWD